MSMPVNTTRPAGAAEIELIDLAAVTGVGGVVWSVSPQGFHTNLVVLDANGAIGVHRNDSVDVLVVVLTGDGTATIGDQTVSLAPMTALLIERGATRSISAGPMGLRYLTTHDQRGPLSIGPRKEGTHV